MCNHPIIICAIERSDRLMPNQRKTGKKQIAIWLTKDERDALKHVAFKQGIDVTELVRRIALGKVKGSDCEKNSNEN